MKNYTRDELIKICEDAVVHHTKWYDRDSYLAQQSICSIYEGLTAGLEFKVVTKKDDPDYHSDNNILIIEFIQPINLDKIYKYGKELNISDIDDYWIDCDPKHESEMFSNDGEGIDWKSDYTQSYMPTRKRLNKVDGEDWYM